MVQVASFAGRVGAEAADSVAKADVRGDQRMAELALALQMQLEAPEDSGEKWPLGTTLAFAISVSAALWVVIGVAAYFVI